MPYTIKSQQIAVKDPDTGEYVGVDLLTEQTTEGLLNEIETLGNQKKNAVITEGTNQVTNVRNAGTETVTLVNNTVSQSQTAVNNLQQQKDDIVTSVTDMLSTGTDNTLTTPSVPADAKAVGDLYETVVVDSEAQPNKRWNRVWVKPSTEDVEIPTMDEVDLINNTIGLNSFLTGVATDTYRGITIEKQYNELTINGTATGNARFKVSNTMAHAVSVQDSWLTETIDIPNGSKKVIIEIVSGEVTSGSVYCALYKSNGETTFVNITDTTTTEPRNIITFEKNNNNAACVCVYCPVDTSVNNLNLRFTLFDPRVYGGTIDVVSGKLIINKISKHLSELTWKKNTAFTCTFNGDGFTERKINITSYNNPDLLCDTYPWYNSSGNNSISNDIPYQIALSAVSTNSKYLVYVRDERYSTLEAWTASFEDHDPLIVCPLQTPREIQLTPQEVECFAGVNNIWADTGDVTVTYPVDTKTYIDKKIQEAIDGLSGS